MGDYLRHLFLPHHTNNFRAKLLHVDFFAAYVIILFIFSLSTRTAHKIDPSILGYATDIRVEQLLLLTNEKRTQVGVGKLGLNNQLSQAAARKAEHMFSHNYWAHTAPDGTTPWDFINNAGYVYTVAGENLAKNFSDSSGVVEAWMNSPSHRENLLRGQYKDIGFAVVNGVLNGEETTLVVQMFGSPLSQQIAATKVAGNQNTATELVPPVISVQAQEEGTPVAQFAEEPTPTPPLEVAAIVPPPSPVSPIVSTEAQVVIQRPLIDITRLSQYVSLWFSSLLMVVLVIDALYVWRHKVVRVGGRTAAHLLFLFIINTVIWYMSFGSIL